MPISSHQQIVQIATDAVVMAKQLGQGLDLEGDTDSNESKPLDLKNIFNALVAE